ncbi:MAG: Franean1_4349 family RiPP [Anaerolineae bacterium]|nr:Franean1_4349 family RiPP [Anaerolineae bacterium]
MSKEVVQMVIGRAVTEPAFRKQLFTNPERALKNYDLTQEEIAALKTINAEHLENFVGGLDERISKGKIVL